MPTLFQVSALWLAVNARLLAEIVRLHRQVAELQGQIAAASRPGVDVSAASHGVRDGRAYRKAGA